MRIRSAAPADAALLPAFILQEGANPWNWLPEDGVRQTAAQLASGEVAGVVLEAEGELLGVMLYCRADHYPAYRPSSIPPEQAAYVIEAVVSRRLAGQGWGSRLLLAACARLAEEGARWVCADRHEENAGSAGMMRKAGFAVLGAFEDERRNHGSRRTAVCGRYLDPASVTTACS